MLRSREGAIFVVMRPGSIALALSVLSAACGSSKTDAPPAPTPGSGAGSASSGSAAGSAEVKKPVDTRPLPPLAADPGGGSGAPLGALGFGGLGIDSARAIAVTPTGEAYLAGYFDGEIDLGGTLGKRLAEGAEPTKTASNGFLVKVGADGKLAWAQTFGGKREDTANDVAVRGNTVVVVGNFTDDLQLGEFTKKSAGSDDAFVAAFDASGVIQWAWNFGGIDSDGANTVAATPDGGWVIGGSFSATAEFGPTTFKTRGGTDAMLIKLAATGDLEWAKRFGGAYPDSITHVAVDGQGNIVVQGQFKDLADWGGEKKLKAGGGSDNDVVLAKYDLNGDHLWSSTFGNAFNDVAGGVTVDPSGHITMVGSFDKTVSFGEGDDHTAVGESDIFVARFTPMGKLAWAHTYGGDREDIGMGVASDAAGNTVTTGWFQGGLDFGAGALMSKGNKDVFALKLDAKGAVVWSQSFGDKDHDQGRAVAIDDKGTAFLTGIYRFKLTAGATTLQSARAEGDRIPKPDTFVLHLDR